MDVVREIVRTIWGYEEFRPLQAEAVAAVLAGRDSVVVLPTGGGKSLCFQAPALAMPGVAVVVSPLIALMHDQVDALVEAGVAAAYVNSTVDPQQRRRTADEIRAGRIKLLYLSPERLTTDRTLDFLEEVRPSFFAIDEAHCISEWGHDFRPEYRMLSLLKERFPDTAVHAYTATATERVRRDIVRELSLKDPLVYVGSFDRPNLVYRVERRTDGFEQLRSVIERHPGESGVVYCVRRADVEDICSRLVQHGFAALPYHAGLPDEVRRRNQDAFLRDKAKIIVATVAFGMGIDKSDVRFVVHAAAPKSLESYQQESGRAGRDGLEAECCMFFSGADFRTWRSFQKELAPDAAAAAATLLDGMERYCNGMVCRHGALLEYFGQAPPYDNCQACDICLDEVDLADDSLVTAQKILSCVARLRESFGGEYTSQVLIGSRDSRILEKGHDKLSTWGLLEVHDKRQVRDWIEQLVGQGYLAKDGEYGVLQITVEGRQVLQGSLTPRLAKASLRGRTAADSTTKKRSKSATESWEGVDRGLFEALRNWRRETAEVRGLPPFIIFGDAVLRDLARFRPSTSQGLLSIRGIGRKKHVEHGDALLQVIVRHCRDEGRSTDVET